MQATVSKIETAAQTSFSGSFYEAVEVVCVARSARFFKCAGRDERPIDGGWWTRHCRFDERLRETVQSKRRDHEVGYGESNQCSSPTMG